MMTRYGNDWPTYTVGYGNIYKDDELYHAAETARYFSARHTMVELPFLVAYVVPSSGCNIDQTRIRSLLCEHLPFFMVPEKIICIEKMPLTLNGKVDEEKLRSYVDRVDDNNTASIDKESPISEAFLELARGIINDLRVKLEDDVINSGISSLQAIELSCAVRRNIMSPFQSTT